MAVGKIAEPRPIPSVDDARLEILERLENWRCHLVAFDRGASNNVLPRSEIVERIDMWLERLCDTNGIHCLCGDGECKETTHG